ncbi:MAG: hypothetical protein DWQ42_17480 [Planctomycetota bacterium]|nr:MAG: hypothetical protein DWQ42_17480 [Planctomycetota bacterium]REK41042.1 MAG: hypothetical protein DWQ46_14455 [Planctomycetota bacterium]
MVSRSRSDEASAATDVARRRNNDLAMMVRQGRSFSGRERNCVFLNTARASSEATGAAATVEDAATGPRFADISAVSGLDWPDDGRGIAMVDWDADGDLDVWFSNRNAPRLRLMRNESKSALRSVSLKLAGNGSNTNRDAIGARVEVVVTEGGPRRLLRTLRAGEGFLSQSTKWLHFGVGSAAEIERVLVRWPNRDGAAGNVEAFTGVAPGGRYVLRQGTGAAEMVSPRAAVKLSPQKVELPKPASSIRVATISNLRLPPREFRDNREQRPVVVGAGRTVWINLWASWCKPCREELVEMKRREADLRAAGIDVVALSVDGIDKERGDVDAAKAFLLSQLRFPFAAGEADEREIEFLQSVDSKLVALQRPLPVPTSFLIAPSGDVAYIYKGRVTVDQVLEDVRTPRETIAERWQAAAPLGGTLIDVPGTRAYAARFEATQHYRLALDMLAAQALPLATDNLRRAIELYEPFAEAHSQLGSVLALQSDMNGARVALQRAVELNPLLASARYGLVQLEVIEGRLHAAVAQLREAIRGNGEETFRNARLLPPSAADDPARQQLRQRMVVVHRDVAWQMATAADESMRDGEAAVRWAERVVDATSRREPNALMTLAAAYAETGRFDEALASLAEARKLVETLPATPPAAGGGQSKDASGARAQLLAEIADQQSAYEAGKPFRENVGSADSPDR